MSRFSPQFNGVELTPESIRLTREWFSENSLVRIEEAKLGKVFVNDLDYYSTWRRIKSEEYLDGIHDNNFAFLQRAYHIQTGEWVALLQF